MQNLIISMLKENTGIHIMDSGGENGRAWQCAQGIDYPTTPGAVYDREDDYLMASTYHHLMNVLDTDALCREFNALPVKDWNSDAAYGLSAAGEDFLNQHNIIIGKTWNTYNGDSLLDRTLQGANLHLAGNESSLEFPDYHLLQVHGGADVRGGYTDAKLFKTVPDHYLGLVDIYATIDGKPYDTCYNGTSLTDEDGKPPIITKESKIEVYAGE